MIFTGFGIVVCALIFLMVRYSLFLPATKGLPVLLYHKVSANVNDTITISPGNLEKQLSYLCSHGYETISMKQLLDHLSNGLCRLPKKPVMITFDDGYVNNVELAYPLLIKYNCKATIFIPAAGIGKTNWWDRVQEPLMSTKQLQSFDKHIVELGLHSFDHKHLGNCSKDQIDLDIQENCRILKDTGIDYVPAFAYPYGGRPKDKVVYKSMLESFKKAGVLCAFRIGNRVNRLPLKNVFEINRISIQGSDSLWTFKTKLLKGRVKQV